MQGCTWPRPFSTRSSFTGRTIASGFRRRYVPNALNAGWQAKNRAVVEERPGKARAVQAADNAKYPNWKGASGPYNMGECPDVCTTGKVPSL
jgi:hypothetical protein